jgi:amino-acid N-acetyltransferase
MIPGRSPLPPECILRPATAADVWAIRKLVFSAKLDPTQLRWAQFSLIEAKGRVIACGQLRSFEAAQELGSLVVATQWRGQGLGQHLARHLIEISTQPLYLECLGPRLTAFYQKLGFQLLDRESPDWKNAPRSLQRKFDLSKLLATWLHFPLAIMHYPPPSDPLPHQKLSKTENLN